MDWALVTNFFAAMLAIVNPVGKVPVWIKCSRGQDDAARWRLALLVTLTAGTILVGSLWFGSAILELFSIDLPSFRVGGGIVILLTGLAMLRGEATDIDPGDEEEDEDPMGRAKERLRSILVPMAVPILAGPGSITTAIVYSNRVGGSSGGGESFTTLLGMTGVVMAVMAIIYVTLLVAPWVRRVLGDVGLAVVTRLFGLVLVAIAAQLVAEGLAELFPAWTTSQSPVKE
ncbi:MAG: MarC family protein [Planctomycetota bacterium]